MPARPFLPESGDPFAAGLGGTEQAIIHLTSALAARGHSVRVAGGCARPRAFQGVDYLPPGPTQPASITVAINDARLLPPTPGAKLIWFHNEVEFARELRKRRMRALWRHRPGAVFIGTEQANAASRLLPFSARAIIPYGLPPAVLQADPAGAPPGPHAVFTSQAYRGLRQVIGMWRSHIAPHMPGARLSAFIAASDVAAYRDLAEGDASIVIQPRVGNHEVLETLRGARLLIAPGHRSETFCLAAAEAIAMGVPVVTRGIGSLKERVVHGATGFIAPDWRELAAHTGRVLTDDALWRRLHQAGLATRRNNDWDHAAAKWDAFAHELTHGIASRG